MQADMHQPIFTCIPLKKEKNSPLSSIFGFPLLKDHYYSLSDSSVSDSSVYYSLSDSSVIYFVQFACFR